MKLTQNLLKKQVNKIKQKAPLNCRRFFVEMKEYRQFRQAELPFLGETVKNEKELTVLRC